MSQPHPQRERTRIGIVAFTLLGHALALSPGSPFGIWLGTGAVWSCALVAAFAADGPRLRELLRPTRRTLALGVACGLALGACTHAVYPLTASLLPTLAAEAIQLDGLFDAPPGRLGALPILLMVVLGEEVVMRGLAFDLLARRFPTGAAVVLATLLYTAQNAASGTWLLPVLSLVFGAIWTALRAATGSLVAPLACHLIWDLFTMIVSPLR